MKLTRLGVRAARMGRVCGAWLALSASCAWAAPDTPQPPFPPTQRIMVKLKADPGEPREPAWGGQPSAQWREARSRRTVRLAQAAGYPGMLPWQTLHGPWVRTALPSRLDAAAFGKLQKRLMASGQVEWVQLDRLERPHAVTMNDPYYGTGVGAMPDEQWWFRGFEGLDKEGRRILRRGVPDIEKSRFRFPAVAAGTGTVVAVLDTGMRTHEDLPGSPSLLPGYDFFSAGANEPPDRDGTSGRDADVTDPGDGVTAIQAATQAYRDLGCAAHADSWHGLAIAGVLLAPPNNGRGIVGVNPGARLLPIRVAGPCGAAQSDIVAAMLWAAGQSIAGVPDLPPADRARVVSLSFGSPGACDPFYRDAVSRVRQMGVTVLASAGNERGAVSQPANCPGALAVSAVNAEGYKSTYANFGPEVALSTVGGDPDFRGRADGGRWDSLLGDGGLVTLSLDTDARTSIYVTDSGTSFSTPIAAGVVSLMLDRNPALTPDQVEEGLRRSIRPHVTSNQIGACSASNPGRCLCTTRTCGAGLLDADEALRFAADPAAFSPLAGQVAANIDTAAVVAAVQWSAQDRGAQAPAVQVSSTRAVPAMGGGGAVSASDLVALLGLAAATLGLEGRCGFRRRRARSADRPAA